MLTSLAHEYRSGVRFPCAGDSSVEHGSHPHARVQDRASHRDRVVSYQFRNILAGAYEQVPGFTMPRQTQFYGVRWDFWN